MTNNNTDKDKTLKQREQIPNEYKWDIEAMYPDETAWDRDVADSIKAAEDFKRFQGRVTESADTLYEALSEKDVIWQKLEHAYVYAAMRKDEDNRVTKYQTMDDKCGSALAKASAAMSFFAPELLAAPEEKILSLEDDSLFSEIGEENYNKLMEEIRDAIEHGCYQEYKKKKLEQLEEETR